MIAKDSPSYIPSSILSKKIKLFNDHAKTLLPFLRENTKLIEIDTGSQSQEKSKKEIFDAVEPTILIVRNVTESGNESDDDIRKNIIWSLTSNWGYSEINVNELISLENERRTNLGKLFMSSI